jgi:hypothetical protein
MALITFSSCSRDNDGWSKTKEGALVYFEADSFWGGEYSWSGDTLAMGIAYGPGVLSFEDRINKSNNFVKKVYAYCGTVDEPSSKSDYVVGRCNDNLRLDGFGVKVDGDRTYIGHFDEGKLKGYGVIYEDGVVLYRGKVKNDLPNGIGKMFYRNHELKYEGKFKDGEYNGYGIAYDTLGVRFEHVWTKGKIDRVTYRLYQHLRENEAKLTSSQYEDTAEVLLTWERYHVWMYIGWILFAAVILFIGYCFSIEDNKDVMYDRAKHWSFMGCLPAWLFFGWFGAHRYKLHSGSGIIYPIWLVLLLFLNIRELSIYLFCPSSWAIWEVDDLTKCFIILFVAFWIFDLFWIGWRCYQLNYEYYRHDKNEKLILSHTKTPIMSLGESVAFSVNNDSERVSDALMKLKVVERRKYSGDTGLWKRFSGAFSGDDPWLKFEKKRAEDMKEYIETAVSAQHDYAELCKNLNTALNESRVNAYRNFALAKELIALVLASEGKHQKLVSDVALDTKKINVISIDALSDIQTGIDWNNTIDSACDITSKLYSSGMKGGWAVGIGAGVSLLSGIIDSVNAAQKACEEVNSQCYEAIKQLGPVCDKITESRAQILRSGEIIIALNKANEAFWHAYADLRDKVFCDKPSIYGFVKGIHISKEVCQNVEFKESVVHLIRVCSEYNKINNSKL